ncbi:MAG: hypothetical protein M1831_002473 [Alyxoria varia]|nr:MAG: hypothetical protein M1831_002473 [Alyxoria varia]
MASSHSATSQEPPPYDKLVVGAAVFRQQDNHITILLVKRADHEHFYPGHYEIPGGKMEPQDASPEDAAARELREETGLTMKGKSDIIACLPGFDYGVTKKVQVPGSDEGEVVTRKTRQLNFALKLERIEDVKVDPKEHSTYIWAEMKDVDGLPMTVEMRDVVRGALRWAAENPSSV